MFDKIKGLMEMQKKMQDMKRQLDSMEFEVSSSDGLIRIKMNGSQEVKDLSIEGDIASGFLKEKLERSLKDVVARAIKRSHEMAAQKMKDQIGFNLPGL